MPTFFSRKNKQRWVDKAHKLILEVLCLYIFTCFFDYHEIDRHKSDCVIVLNISCVARSHCLWLQINQKLSWETLGLAKWLKGNRRMLNEKMSEQSGKIQ